MIINNFKIPLTFQLHNLVHYLSKYSHMKKTYIMLIISLTLLTGCFNDSSKTVTEKNMTGQIYSSYDESQVVGRVNELKNGLAPVVKPTGSSKNTMQEEQNTKTPNQFVDNGADAENQLELLSAEYNEAVIKTSLGDIVVRFYDVESPITVNNFMNLAKKDFYDDTLFHRVMKDFMIQGGDPNSKSDDWSTHGMGGPDYRFQDEFNDHKLVKGSLAMANSGPNTNGSQFFIVTTEATPWLDGKHTNFGYVVEGMDVVEKIENVQVNGNDHPLEDVKVLDVLLRRGEIGPEKPVAIEESQADRTSEIVNTDKDSNASSTNESNIDLIGTSTRE